MSMQTPIGEINLMSLLCDPDYEENKPETNTYTEQVRQSKSMEIVEVEQPKPSKIVEVVEVVELEKKKTNDASCQTHVS